MTSPSKLTTYYRMRCGRQRQVPSQAGAAFGLRMAGMDGKGFGRCVTILAGGRSGGSKADVLGASFHPRLPLIATCNMDRTCKIWHLAMLIDHQPTLLRRPDKPLFSSSNIHAGRAVSIHWVTDDVLLSINDQSKYLKGTIVMWKWLSFERYMGQKETYKDIASPNFHGLVTDFQESESFSMLAASQLPHDVFYASPRVQFIREGKSRWLLYCLPGHSQTVWCIGLENIHRCFEEGSRSDEGLKMVEAMTIQTDMDLFTAYFLESTKDIIVTDRGGDIHRWGIDEQPRQA
ncbi:hypothetical protein DL96DRAFT_34556 [Flagelloscypha sp. PMI_526]|nr:hypothetical protein DL96DRAFT_34556 [Flagelloscypha sp. PMI_526]